MKTTTPKESPYIESYDAYLPRRTALTAEVEKRYFGRGFDEDDNRIKSGYAPLIALFKEFATHYRPYVLRNNAFEDEEYELLEKMLDVEDDDEKLDAIMDEIRVLHFTPDEDNCW